MECSARPNPPLKQRSSESRGDRPPLTQQTRVDLSPLASPRMSPTLPSSRRNHYGGDRQFRSTSLEDRSNTPSPQNSPGNHRGFVEYYGTAELAQRSRTPSPLEGMRNRRGLFSSQGKLAPLNMPTVAQSPTMPSARVRMVDEINFPRLCPSPTNFARSDSPLYESYGDEGMSSAGSYPSTPPDSQPVYNPPILATHVGRPMPRALGPVDYLVNNQPPRMTQMVDMPGRSYGRNGNVITAPFGPQVNRYPPSEGFYDSPMSQDNRFRSPKYPGPQQLSGYRTSPRDPRGLAPVPNGFTPGTSPRLGGQTRQPGPGGFYDSEDDW